MFHSVEKSDTWTETVIEHIKLSNARGRRLASFDDGTFCPSYVVPFSKFVKTVADIIAEITNYTNKIEKKILCFISSPDDGNKQKDSGIENVLKLKKETPTSRVGRVSLEEAEETLLKIQGTYEKYSFMILFLSFSRYGE